MSESSSELAVARTTLFLLIGLELTGALALVVCWAGFAYQWWAPGVLGAGLEMFLVAMHWWCDSTSGTLAFMLAACSLVGLAALHVWQLTSDDCAAR